MFTGYVTKAEEVIALIQRYDRIVVSAHANPDGDAVGACGAMAYILKALKKKVAIYNSTGIPDHLSWVPLPCKVITQLTEIPFNPELFIVLDCGDVLRLGKELASTFLDYHSINIDHHTGNTNFGTLYNWVEPQAAATGQLIADLAYAAGIPVIEQLAQCLYLSIITDTGSFTYSNTTPEVLLLTAKLIKDGLDITSVREQVDNQWSPERFNLWGKLMQEITLEYDQTVALCTTTLNDIIKAGTTKESLEGFVEQMRKIKGVRVSVLIREDAKDCCKVSLRSMRADNVRDVAAYFGGGGHINAAGATIPHDLQTTKQYILEAINTMVLS